MVDILNAATRVIAAHEEEGQDGLVYVQIPPPVQQQLDRIEAKLDALLRVSGLSGAV